MRYFIAILVLSCCAVTGYSQETAETPKEVTENTDEGAPSEVANVDSLTGGCGGR